jgi:F-type H+-transporting ATPase subunit b
MMRRTALAAAVALMLPWALALGIVGATLPTLAQEAAPPVAAPPVAGQEVEAPTGATATAGDPDVAQTTEERAEAVGLDYDEEHGAGAGMPQLDAATYASQILWLILTFSLLYYLLKTKALPRVADILEARQERISNDLDKAAALRVEAEAAAEEYAKVVADAQAKASEAIKATRDAVTADISARGAALDKELGAKIAGAESAIDAARKKALTELEQVAVEAAQAATRQLIGVEVSVAEAEAALAQAQKDVA